MQFTFIYVDDDPDDREKLVKAVTAHNASSALVTLSMALAKNVNELRSLISSDVDLVLADVNYAIGGLQVDMLSEIIDAVTAWTKDTNHSPIPIISYTGFGPSALNASLKRKDKLLDIWDKDSCSEEYVTWRLAKFAVELSRLRPDTFLQRLIREMPRGCRWHDVVVQMPASYNVGNTESAQIREIGSEIEKIGARLGVLEHTEEMWQIMSGWEMLSRAVSPTIRGHARHVVNVFWMGYYLIYEPRLSGWFEDKWQSVLAERTTQLKAWMADDAKKPQFRERLDSLEEVLASGKYLESLSDAWYFAALFHDVANCVPKYREFRKVGDNLVQKFGCVLTPLSATWIPKELKTEGDQLFFEMDSTVTESFRPLWEESLKRTTPDHGVVGALHLRRGIRNKTEMGNAFEAARAIFAHNFIGEQKVRGKAIVNWERDPLVCLLILCDQIQTWDRERGDEDIAGPDFPSRAQLTGLQVSDGAPPRIDMNIQYIVPPHIEHSDVLYHRMKVRLEEVLRQKPMRAMSRLGPAWPFKLRVECSLGAEQRLETITMGE